MTTIQQLVTILKDLLLGRHVTIHVRRHSNSINAYDHPETIGWGELEVDSQGNVSIKVTENEAHILWYKTEIVLFLHGHVYFGKYIVDKSIPFPHDVKVVSLSLKPIE